MSHRPGNRSPGWLRADTSTEMVIRLNESPQRSNLLAGIDTVTNDRYDADGALAVFAALRPDLAARHRRLMIDAATFGDFSRLVEERAARVAIALTAGEESLSDEDQYAWALERLEGLLADPERFRDRWIGRWQRIVADLELIETPAVEVRLGGAPEMAVVRSGRPLAYEALVTAARGRVRILSIVPADGGGFCYELFETIDTWFVMGSRLYRPRIPLGPLAARRLAGRC